MSPKHTIFPPSAPFGREENFRSAGQDETARPAQQQASSSSPETAEEEVSGRDAAKGRAAYAAHEGEMPPFSSQRRGFGPIGGLFADDAAGPTGHGVQTKTREENPLSVIAEDALREECQQRLCPQCPVKKEADELRLRALADLDNARKRMEREREEQIRFASEAVLSDIIPSLDNLDLALQHAGNDEASKNLVVGVEMTRKLLQEALAKHGLVRVGEVGEEFDPALHEAVGMVDSAEYADGHICSLLSHGYTLKDRLLRPARVVVCKKS